MHQLGHVEPHPKALFMKRIHTAILVAVLALVPLACSTTGTAPTASPDSDGGAGKVKLGSKAAETGEFPRVTLDQEESTLGETVRKIGQQSGGGLVLAFGLESIELPALKFSQANYETVAQKLATLSKSALQNCSTYYFLMKPGTEVLRDVSLLGKLHPRYDNERAGLRIGAGTRVYTALALLNEATNANVVADNAIADVRCGELALPEIPVQYGIEAILKSAQIIQFEAESTDEYIFIRYNLNDSRQDTLLNRAQLDERQLNYLEQRVSVALPEPSRRNNDRAIIAGAMPLYEVVDTLSEQLGITVVAERSMREFPVNPMVLKNVRIETAMNLLIRQWPVGEFGYQFTHDRLVIRRMTREERAGV